MRFSSLTAISLAGFAHARLPGLSPRMPSHEKECCPCPVDGAPDAPVTVTVTEPAKTVHAPEKTVIVEHTVVPPAETVIVSEVPETIPTPKPVTKEIPVEEDDVVTKTIQPEPEESPEAPEEHPEEDEPEHPAEGPKTVTIHPTEESPAAPEIVTVTKVPEHPAPEPTAEDEPEDPEEEPEQPEQPKVITKTLAPMPEEDPKTIVEEPAVETHEPEPVPETKTVEEPAVETHEPETVIVSHEPSIATVTEGASVTTKTAQVPHTVTVAPEPTVQTQEHMKTVTETVTDGHGNIDIEIIIININTGDKTCHMKDSGDPCPDEDETTSVPTPQTTVCASVEPSTRLETTFNTVTVTVDEHHSIQPNGTAPSGVAQPTVMARKPRGAQPAPRLW